MRKVYCDGVETENLFSHREYSFSNRILAHQDSFILAHVGLSDLRSREYVLLIIVKTSAIIKLRNSGILFYPSKAK